MALAETTDIAVRLGRDLTAAETELVQAVIDQVTGEVTEIIGTDAAALDPVPATLKGLCVEKALQVGANPTGARSHSEAIGAYNYSESFDPTPTGVLLSDADRARVKRAVFGSNLISPRTPPVEDDYWPEEIDDFFFGS